MVFTEVKTESFFQTLLLVNSRCGLNLWIRKMEINNEQVELTM